MPPSRWRRRHVEDVEFRGQAKQVPRIAGLEEPGLMVVVGHRISQVMFGAEFAYSRPTR